MPRQQQHAWTGPNLSVLAQQVAPGGKYENLFGHQIMQAIAARGTTLAALYRMHSIWEDAFYETIRLVRHHFSDAQIFDIADFLQIDPLDLLRPYHHLSPGEEMYYEVAYLYQAYPRRDESIRAGIQLLVQGGRKQEEWRVWQLTHDSLPKSRYASQVEGSAILAYVSPGGFYENAFGSGVLAGIRTQRTTIQAAMAALDITEHIFNAVLKGIAYTLSDAQVIHLAEMLALPPLSLLLPYHGIEEERADTETHALIEQLAWLLREYPRCDEPIRQGVRALLRGSPAVYPYFGTPRLGKLKVIRARKKKEKK